MTEDYLKCNNPKWEFCQIKDGVCVNCERGRASVMRCTNPDFPVCEFAKSKKFPDGICINCGKVSCSAKTVIDKIESQIRLYADNFELFHDLGDVIRENNVQLTPSEIRTICTYWYKQSKATRKRLDDSNELFRILDHANSGLLQPLNVDYNENMINLGYVTPDREEEDYD